MTNDLATRRKQAPDFKHWESPETKIRWERGIAMVAGMIAIVVAFFAIFANLPLNAKTTTTGIAGQVTATPRPSGPAASGPANPTASTPTPNPSGAALAATSRAFPNVRRAPALGDNIVKNLSQGQKVDVVGRSTDGQWLQILDPDNRANRFWVSTDMLEVTGDPRTLPEVRQ